MIQQTVLPFKLERTREEITGRSGLSLYAEFMKAMGVEAIVDRHMPLPGSGNSFEAIDYIKPLSMMLYGGGQTIEDIREIREDRGLREITGFKKLPSSSAIGDWLKRIGLRGGIKGMEGVNREIARKVIGRDTRDSYTLIIDPTIIESGKKEAMMTYLGFKGYRPVIATLKEIDLNIAYEFREGNNNGGRVEILKKVFLNMPEDKKIKEVLLDAEYYTNEVMEYLNLKGVKYAIAVDKDEAVMREIKAITEENWKPLKTKEGDETDREIAETVHTTNKGKESFRLIVIRWKERQGELFKDDYNYHVIATSMNDELPEEVVWKYNGRANIENHIKELKNGFGMEYLPSGDFKANSVHFSIGVMTYNLFIAQRLFVMPEDWRKRTIKSIRWLFVETAGKLIEHSRRLILKIAASIEKYRIYLEMRRKTYELLMEMG